MAFSFHKDRDTYIEHQRLNANEYVIPFIERTLKITTGLHVMEIGCGEGGVLKAMLDKGCSGVGVELSSGKAERARELLQEEIASGQASIIEKNIYDVDIAREFPELFDLIILKDVIEHIHDQDAIMKKMREFLKPSGRIFFGFPPWQMPFGGHQQALSHRILSKLPYYHLLPAPLYRFVLKMSIKDSEVESMMEIKETGISIERFERIVRKQNYAIESRNFYLTNPIYRFKFNLKPRLQFKWISQIPYFRNFLTTCMYYVVRKEG
ncbi:MAG: class I SAM-dependent methyltransferase [Flavobacteriales bacterium]